ncbi:hypothetical protein LSH36_141g04013 [Paralvinella palmiformis]|uniref:UNC93-like protein n=1 Tax=Paralvinella palmiformis TaxID=53620 RepID=A0AAD9NAG8_9ANNE|nr:hypothetical protein LSH36_141g04013 [Paralvinella palmiformis]
MPPGKTDYQMNDQNDDVRKRSKPPKGSSRDNVSSRSSSSADYENEAHLPTTDKERSREKRRIMKNIVLISVAFFLNFTSYNGLARLQSSLHRDEGMGTTNQAVLYAALVLSCLFVPKLLISVIGHKWTIPLSFSGYILWMAANGYAVWGTMVTTSILVGLCAAPLWTAQCAYFTKIATRYAQLTGEPEPVVVSRFFGIFFMFFQCSSILGSVISSTVLMPTEVENGTLTDDDIKLYCGLNDCPDNNVTNPNLDDPDDETVWTMVGIYIACAVLAVILVSAAVDELPKYMREDRSKAKEEAKRSAVNTVLHLRHLIPWLLVPITLYSGFEQAFYSAEWNNVTSKTKTTRIDNFDELDGPPLIQHMINQFGFITGSAPFDYIKHDADFISFISCSLGIWNVGWVTLPFGIVNAIVSFTGGHIVKYTGRVAILTVGMLADLSMHLTMILWDIDASKEYVFYVMSGIFGLTDGIWQTQINALYGSIFSDESEAAFSNYRMWESLGFIIAFAYSSALCTSIKLYVVMAVLFVGMFLYYIVEGKEKKRKRREDEKNRSNISTSISTDKYGDLSTVVISSVSGGTFKTSFDDHYENMTIPDVGKEELATYL